MNLELLYANGSNCAQRVRWALNYKQLPYTVMNYEDVTGEEIKQISPLGKIPALIVDGRSFAESVAMLEFIEEIKPEPHLLPKTALLRAKVREAVEIINGWIHPIQCSSVPRFFLPDLSDSQVKELRLRWLQKTLTVLHDCVLFNESDYAVGSAFTWADLAVIPIYIKALMLGLGQDFFPKFNKHIVYIMSDEVRHFACPEDLLCELRKRTLI